MMRSKGQIWLVQERENEDIDMALNTVHDVNLQETENEEMDCMSYM